MPLVKDPKATWSAGSKESPIKLYNVTHPGLPMYEMAIGPPTSVHGTEPVVFIPVQTILNTGAESNYILAPKACIAGAQIFPITAQEIVGAGWTMTSAFASFTLKVRGMLTQCYAYILEDTTQF